MTTASQTTAQQIANVALGGKLREYVTERREAGKSWRRVAIELRDDHRIDVSHQTLANWFPDLTERVA